MRKLVLKLGALLGAVLLINACQDGDRTMSAQPAGVADLAAGGFSQEGFDDIQEMMETAITDGRISAGIAMVARD